MENANGTHLVRLTHDNDNDHPKWSPDGGLIAFDRAHDLDLSSTLDIFLVRPGGGGMRNLTEPGVTKLKNSGPPEVYGFSWSPRGRFIVYATDRGVYPFPIRLWVVSRDGRRNELLTNPPEGDNDSPAWDDSYPNWSRDGHTVVFERLHPLPGYDHLVASIRAIRLSDRRVFRITL